MTADKAKHDKLARQIGVSIILGLGVGLILHSMNLSEYSSFFKPVGDVFIRCLKLIIIPLVFSSIYMSIVNIGDPNELGKLGKKTLIYYFLTTSLAVAVGLVFVNLFQPGVGVNLDVQSSIPEALMTKLSGQKGLFQTIIGVLVDAIPSNPIQAMAKTSILQVIVFAIFFGLIGLYYSKESEPFTKVVSSIEKMSFLLINGVMKFAPIGIFALMAEVVASAGVAALLSVAKYMGVVILGLFCHGVILLLIGSVRAKKSPLFIFKGLSSAVFTAFSTASSAATLPITMASVQKNLGVREKTANFVLPLGATVNMDGTALYESVAVIFIAEVYGIDLTIAQQFIVFITASLAAIGAAAVPGAGLVTMTIVLGAVGLPLEGIGLVLSVDRILDMFRTAVNVLGDGVGTVVVDSFSQESEG